MATKKFNLRYKKERVVLSDMLPYEIPVTFSNRHFYQFLVINKINYSNGKVNWKKDDDSLDKIISLIFGFKPPKAQCFISIPFGYKISHKENEFRELTICHPRNQLQMVDFYDQFKELILYYCSISPFSIRRPQRVAKFVYHKDKTHYDNLSGEYSRLEQHDEEYENLRSFFVYKDYSNVYKFYESYKFHRCEKKYNKLLKLDISKCFDSIYTHSIAWALLNKNSVKENIKQSKETFAGLFDSLMQQLNYNETNGIVVGPEFSRIFAELILQSIYRDLALVLKAKHLLKHKEHYEIFRYVDDYFVFYNDEATKWKILEILQLLLKEYKLFLNVNKQIIYEKPIITEISIAKQRIKEFFNDKLVYKLEKIKDEDGCETYKGSINIRSNPLITQFKTIIKDCNVEYKDMLNYSLSIVEGNSERILKNYLRSDEKSEEQLNKAIVEIIDFVFFIYSVSPRVNTTIKLCRILAIFIYFLKGKSENDSKYLVFKCIYDNICFLLHKNKHDENTQVETLYLLLTLAELGKDYWLSESALSTYLGINSNDEGEYYKTKLLNYFSITVLLLYMKNKKRFAKLRFFIEQQILEKFSSKKKLIWKDAELVLLLLDTLTCPYVSTTLKNDLLNLYDISDTQLQQGVINKRKIWFTNWRHFDFRKELDAKRSKEVY